VVLSVWVRKMTATNKDAAVVVSLVLSLVSLVLLFGVTWYFQSSLDLLQQQVEDDRELLLKLQKQVNAKVIHTQKLHIVKISKDNLYNFFVCKLHLKHVDKSWPPTELLHPKILKILSKIYQY